MPRPKKGEEPGQRLKGFTFNIYSKETITVDLPGKRVNVTGKELLDGIERFAKQDAFTVQGELIKLMVAEYVVRHRGGNPTIPLDHFTPGGPPLSIAAQEKLEKKLPEWGETCDHCHGSGRSHRGVKCRNCAGLGQVGKGENYA